MLWATSSRSKGSRVQSSFREWRTRFASGMSSTVKRVSAITVFMNSGFRTLSRPISARNWISRKETGDTPQGRYSSIQGNSAIRLFPRTSQTKKWVSSRSVNVPPAAGQRGLPLDLSTPRTNDPPRRLLAPAGVSCTAEFSRRSFYRSILLGGARAGVLFVEPRLPRRAGLHRADGTNFSWLRRRLRFSCVQCTRSGTRKSRRSSSIGLFLDFGDSADETWRF